MALNLNFLGFSSSSRSSPFDADHSGVTNPQPQRTTMNRHLANLRDRLSPSTRAETVDTDNAGITSTMDRHLATMNRHLAKFFGLSTSTGPEPFDPDYGGVIAANALLECVRDCLDAPKLKRRTYRSELIFGPRKLKPAVISFTGALHRIRIRADDLRTAGVHSPLSGRMLRNVTYEFKNKFPPNVGLWEFLENKVRRGGEELMAEMLRDAEKMLARLDEVGLALTEPRDGDFNVIR